MKNISPVFSMSLNYGLFVLGSCIILIIGILLELSKIEIIIFIILSIPLRFKNYLFCFWGGSNERGTLITIIGIVAIAKDYLIVLFGFSIFQFSNYSIYQFFGVSLYRKTIENIFHLIGISFCDITKEYIYTFLCIKVFRSTHCLLLM